MPFYAAVCYASVWLDSFAWLSVRGKEWRYYYNVNNKNVAQRVYSLWRYETYAYIRERLSSEEVPNAGGLFYDHYKKIFLQRLGLPLPDSSLLHSHLTFRVSSSPLLSSITPSFFHSKLSYFSNPTLHRHLAPLRTDITDTRTALRLYFCFSFFPVFS